MATTARPLYGAVATVPITLASLASSATAGRQSTVVDNGVDKADDSIVQCKITTGTSPTANSLLEIWAYATADGTNYSGGASGTDGAFTPVVKALMRQLEIIQVTSASNQAYHSGPHSIAQAFGGTMPRKWGTFVLNSTGAPLNATAGLHSIQYTPTQYESV